MKRIFTRDIYTAEGKLRWPKGFVSADYPPSTWHDIEKAVGQKMDEFSIGTDGMVNVEPGAIVPLSTVVKAKRMDQQTKLRRRPVTSPRFVA